MSEPDQQSAIERLGELLGAIDGQARRPGEPPLRKVVADHAREQLRAMDADAEAPGDTP